MRAYFIASKAVHTLKPKRNWCFPLLQWIYISQNFYLKILNSMDSEILYQYWLSPFKSLFNRMFEQGCVLSCPASRFASFHETAKADAVLGYLIAFLVLLATIKLWHLLRLNPKLHMITATLQRAWTDISGFLVVITIMFMAYSIAVSRFPHIRSACDLFLKM